MNRVAGIIIKIVVGLIVIQFLVSTLSPGGALGNLTGMLISKYPFHQPLLSVFSDSLGWDVSFVPAVNSAWLDDILILLLAALISGGINQILKNIFNPVDMREQGAEAYRNSTGYRMKGLLVSILSSIVSVLVSNILFASVIQKVNESVIGGVIFTVIKLLILATVVLLFVAFAKGVVSGVSGNGFGIGVFAFFLIRTLVQAAVTVVLTVYLLVAIVNNASGIAGPLFIVYVVLILGIFMTRSLKVY